MRRSLACLALAVVTSLPVVGPVVAGEPVPSAASASAAPSTDPAPSSEPAASVEPGQPSPAQTPDQPPASDGQPPATPDATTPATPTAVGTPGSTESAPDASAAPAAAADGPLAPTTADGRPDPSGRYLVMLRDTTAAKGFVARQGTRNGIHAERTFSTAIHGFAAKLDARQRRILLADPSVLAVVPDELIHITAQTTPTGVVRVGTKKSTVAAINGLDGRVNADVAIVDTGIAKHPDLNVAGGYNCASSDHSLWRDRENHGTHVAGTVGALDNEIGVVGVAPGARVWAVRILNDDGYGLLSWYVCGLDWVLKQRDPVDPSRPLFEAVNMSVTKWGSDDHDCGATNKDILHAAICRVVKGGITVVAAAANDSGSAAKRVPAAYNEVITVSALADTDGKAGGLGGNRCYSWGSYDKDDTFANFSNYGGDVDIMAPGKCIWSTIPGSYAYMSGTSMAAPTVTGAVALYKASRPAATPAEVKEALRYLGNLGWATSTDPDSTHEPLLDVARIGKLGTFAFAADAPAPSTGEGGGTASIPVTISRSATFFERVNFSVTSVPTGWSAVVVPNSVLGWTADTTALKVTVPAGTPQGTYDVTMAAANQGRTKSHTISVTVTNDIPTAVAPGIKPIVDSTVGVTTGSVPSTLAMRVSWAAATDPSSEIVGYELQHRVDGGAWGPSTRLPADDRSVDVAGLDLSATHEFRVRAEDGPGNWSAWATPAAPRAFRVVSDRSSSVTYAGTWKRATAASATNAVRTTSTTAGSTASYSFTGRGIALVMPRSTVRGRVTIYIDGVSVATVDTRSSSVEPRRVVYQKTWSTSGPHKITVKVDGTSGRPTVSIDGFIVIL